MKRRTLIRTAAQGMALALVGDGPFAEAQSGVPDRRPAPSGKPLLGFKQYAMKKIPVREAIRDIARIGYKSLSLTLRPSWDTEPKLMTKTDRVEIRRMIGDEGLVLASVMEGLRLVGPNTNRENNLERLRTAAGVAHELSPGSPALIETTLGGRPEEWETARKQMAEELGMWANALEPLNTVLAVEGHVGNAMDRPDRVLWLLDQVKSPSIGNLLDFSHYMLLGLDLRDTPHKLAARTVLHHVKDGVGTPEKFQFLMPGDSGKVSYREYARIFGEIGYRGTVLAEVSAQIFDRPGYDGVAAANHCWANLAPFFA